MSHNPLDLCPIGVFGAFRPFPDTKEREEKGYLGYSVINKPETAQAPVTDWKQIGDICCNDDKPLVTVKIGNQYGWRIEKWNSTLHNPDEYEIIPEYLYEALIRFENERKN